MRNSARVPQLGHAGGGQTRHLFLPHSPLAGFEEGAKVRTLLRSVVVLDGWLEQNEGRLEDEVRLRRMKRWRGEALQQLRIELNRIGSPYPWSPVGHKGRVVVLFGGLDDALFGGTLGAEGRNEGAVLAP
jgi:hypothetical protein